MNGHSKIRNKGIANIFSQMGLVEAWGSGIKRILNAAEEYGLPKPRFQEFDNMFRVELFRVNPITDQANQATNQDFERLDFFSCLYSRFTCKFRGICFLNAGNKKTVCLDENHFNQNKLFFIFTLILFYENN